MRIAIIGGSSDDERHLGRLSEKAGHIPGFVRPRLSAPAESALPPGVVEHVVDRLLAEALEEQRGDASSGEQNGDPPSTSQPALAAPLARPRALIFDAADRTDRPDAAARVLAAVRRDPYFDRVGTLLVLQAEQAGALTLPGGFDDFVLYPCSVAELSIRVRALRQRRSPFGSARGGDVGVVVDETSRDVFVDGRAVQLTAREFALFTYLCEWRGKVLSREHLLARVWGSRYSGGRRTVDIHVRRLRAKLGASLAIETLRGSGYRLRRDPQNTEVAADLHESLAGEIPSSFTPHSYTDPAYGVQSFTAQIPEPFSKVS